MLQKLLQGLLCMQTALLLSACGDQVTLSSQSTLVTEIAEIDFSSACSVIQLPLSGDNPHHLNPSIARYQQSLSASPASPAQLERLGWAYVAQARESQDSGFYSLALKTADCIEQTAPDSAEFLLLSGHAMLNLHRFEEAEARAQKLVAKRGLWFDHALLGDALLDRGRYDQAALAYQAVMQQRPGPQAYSRAARLRGPDIALAREETKGAPTARHRARNPGIIEERDPLARRGLRLESYRAVIIPKLEKMPRGRPCHRQH